jgi:hypothetical protein
LWGGTSQDFVARGVNCHINFDVFWGGLETYFEFDIAQFFLTTFSQHTTNSFDCFIDFVVEFFSNSKIQKMIFPNVGITSLLAEKITRVGGNDNKCVNFKIGSPNAKGAPKQERLSIYNLDLRL